jgi:hypothetical protein
VLGKEGSVSTHIVSFSMRSSAIVFSGSGYFLLDDVDIMLDDIEVGEELF